MVKAAFFSLSILLVLVLDQWSKFMILDRFDYGETHSIIPDFFNLTYVRNTGAAFGLLASANPSFRVPFFLVVPIVVMVVLGFLYRELPSVSRFRSMALGLVSGGAISNLMDRVRLGYVVDFFDFHFQGRFHFPAFNFADAAICVGVVVLLISTLASPQDAKPETA